MMLVGRVTSCVATIHAKPFLSRATRAACVRTPARKTGMTVYSSMP